MRKIIVIAHDMRSAFNLGSLFRTCEGIGVTKIYLSGYTPLPKHYNDNRLPHLAEKLDKAISKTALGAEKLVPWEPASDIFDLIEHLKSDGYQVCALEQTKNSVKLNKFKANKNIVLILGTEVEGLPQPIIKACDVALEIPMFGQKESFNVVQAAAMALYHIRFTE